MASSSFWLISCRRVDQYVLRSKLVVVIADGEETEEQPRVVVRWEMDWRVVRQQRFGEEDMNVVNAITLCVFQSSRVMMEFGGGSQEKIDAKEIDKKDCSIIFISLLVARAARRIFFICLF